MAVGTSSGILSTRVRNEVVLRLICDEQNTTEEEEQPTILPGAFFARAPAVEKRVRPEIEAKKVEVAAEKRKKLTKWDQYMRKFEYVKALDAVLSVSVSDKSDNQSRSVRDIIALIEELHARSDLPIAIKGR